MNISLTWDLKRASPDAKFTAWEKSQDKQPLEEVVGLLDKVRYFDQIVAEAAGQAVH